MKAGMIILLKAPTTKPIAVFVAVVGLGVIKVG